MKSSQSTETKKNGSRGTTRKTPRARATKKGAAPNLLIPASYPELVIGLVGPIGVDLAPVIKALEVVLKEPKYKTHTIQLSQLIEQFLNSDHSGKEEHVRINNLMNEGTSLREKTDRGEAVALLAIAEIRELRSQSIDNKAERNAFILKSLKHPEEVKLLRAVYGKGFILISVYAPRDVRVSALEERIIKSRNGTKEGARGHAENLVQKDESENGRSLGQDVKDAFPLADLFVDSRNKNALRVGVQRFMAQLFGYRFHTPNHDEHGMFHARAAALRSADMNRQVGAAVLNDAGDVISLGCNDVPKATGGLYWESDSSDARDFVLGVDSSAEQRLTMLADLLDKLKAAKVLNSDKAKNVNELVAELLSGKNKARVKNASLLNLLEFGRSVHAEMAALMSAARLGISVNGATLYCTTFPCHMCARHIVASGIKRVVYIEPYPKSRAKQLHQDSICVDPVAPSPSHVNFEPFQGVAPVRYFDIFEASDLRKDANGRVPEWHMSDGKPRFLRYLNTYRELEAKVTAELLEDMQQKMQTRKRSSGR
jgi:deoxycytidylate deaminase